MYLSVLRLVRCCAVCLCGLIQGVSWAQDAVSSLSVTPSLGTLELNTSYSLMVLPSKKNRGLDLAIIIPDSVVSNRLSTPERAIEMGGYLYIHPSHANMFRRSTRYTEGDTLLAYIADNRSELKKLSCVEQHDYLTRGKIHVRRILCRRLYIGVASVDFLNRALPIEYARIDLPSSLFIQFAIPVNY